MQIILFFKSSWWQGTDAILSPISSNHLCLIFFINPFFHCSQLSVLFGFYITASCFKSKKFPLFKIQKCHLYQIPKITSCFNSKSSSRFTSKKLLSVSNPKNASCFKSQKCKLFQIPKMQAVSNPKNASCSDNSVLALHCWTVLQSNLLQGSCRNSTFWNICWE